MNAHPKMRKTSQGQIRKKIRSNYGPSSATRAPDTILQTVTAAIAHEVNQPLAAAVINAEAALQWLRREPPNLSKAELAIERLIASSLRIANATKSVRDLVQQSTLQLSDVSINDVVNDVLSLHECDLRRGNITVEVDLTESADLVQGDRIQLERLIANLVTNSADAMCAVEDRSRILRLNTKPYGNDSTVVEVMDSGNGIDTATRERLFQPFFTTKQHGMGLGLWLCQAIVERHGGRLWVEQNEPHGSVFKFSLPSSPKN